jgi:hypothetical protein
MTFPKLTTETHGGHTVTLEHSLPDNVCITKVDKQGQRRQVYLTVETLLELAAHVVRHHNIQQLEQATPHEVLGWKGDV